MFLEEQILYQLFYLIFIILFKNVLSMIGPLKTTEWIMWGNKFDSCLYIPRLVSAQ